VLKKVDLMKHAMAAAMALSALAGAAQAQARSPSQVVQFKSLSQNAGTVHVGSPAKAVYQFTNISSAPMIIENIVPSAQTAQVTMTRGAIAAGKQGEVSVSYTVTKAGNFNLPIIVKIAGIESPVTLMLTGKGAN
jgi:hypothetical protein